MSRPTIISVPTNARHIVVQINATNYLHLAEVLPTTN
jgi:hypothetical protein